MSSQNDRLFKVSLVLLCFMILGMVLIGGLTRLTGSGLSIVEWKPITGLLPPLTHAQWLLEFSKYQTSPEFQKINFGMTLSDFQSLFFLEYIHRLWGRLIGFVLFIPTFLMIFKKQHRQLMSLLLLLWLLGLAQGLMGWVMVKSGLNHDPHVSPYCLMAHLVLGFMIFGVTLWMMLWVYRDRFTVEHNSVLTLKSYNHPVFCHPELVSGSKKMLKRVQHDSFGQEYGFKVILLKYKSLITGSFIALFLVLLTASFGALVAGLKAGLLYNTFPMMGETFIPREFLSQPLWWKDLLENPVSVQFLHRLCAITTAVFCSGLWVYQRRFNLPSALTSAFNIMLIATLVQISLGILTLLSMVSLPLALLHQGVAFLVFGSLVYVLFLLYHSSTAHLCGWTFKASP